MIGSTRYTTKIQVSQQAKLSSQIATLQTQISSQKRLGAASDDPAAAARIAAIAQTQADNAVYTKNANTGATIASAVDTQLTTIASALNRANELLITARSDTSSTADRQNLALEMKGIAQDMAGYATATDTNGNPLFPTSPLSLPISDTLSVTATASQAQVFTIKTSDGSTMSLTDFLTAAATRLADPTTATSAISADLTTMGSALDQITSVRTDQGLRAANFDAAKDRLADIGTDLTTERSSLEDTDLTAAVSDLQGKQLALQAAQTLFAQTHKSTLFDLIA
jgi:flagellar hook-associated protein 3 FlgL